MNLIRVLLSLAAVAVASNTASAEPAPAPQAGQELNAMLQINWSRGPNLPQGFQDSDGGVVRNTLITACGFCTGLNNDRKPGRYPRGFLKKVFGIDLANEDAGWSTLPDFPGAARQELFSIVVGDVLYCWGGFSYDPPYCYRDGYRLFQAGSKWTWEPLPDLMWPVCSSGICAVGSKIYVMGGADYDAEAFYTATDRDGKSPRLGARLLVIDIENFEAGWQRLPDCPGTARWVHATAAVGGKAYVLGGATGSPYATVVDNWVFDPKAETWSRLPDLPIASGNFPCGAIAFKNRYILLIGGYQYNKVANPDGTTREPYGTAGRCNDEGTYYNDVFVYDTLKNTFGRADSLPLNNNLPMAVVHGNQLFLIGGETGTAVVEGEFYGHHPELFLKGAIQETR